MSSPSVLIGKSLGSAAATAVAGAGAWVIAQAGALGDWAELIGGGVVLTAGLLSLRMVLRASAHERESAAQIEARLTKALERAEGKVEELELDVETERGRSARLLIAFDRERQLRMSLEQAGIVERRETPDTLELLEAGDVADLTAELEAELAITEEIPEAGDPEA